VSTPFDFSPEVDPAFDEIPRTMFEKYPVNYFSGAIV